MSMAARPLLVEWKFGWPGITRLDPFHFLTPPSFSIQVRLAAVAVFYPLALGHAVMLL